MGGVWLISKSDQAVLTSCVNTKEKTHERETKGWRDSAKETFGSSPVTSS